jgi:hypothetical protein
MKYADGQKAKLGDRVSLGDDESGVVVALIGEEKFDATHPASAWNYLKSGALIEFAKYGLIHYSSLEPDLKLLDRGKE